MRQHRSGGLLRMKTRDHSLGSSRWFGAGPATHPPENRIKFTFEGHEIEVARVVVRLRRPASDAIPRGCRLPSPPGCPRFVRTACTRSTSTAAFGFNPARSSASRIAANLTESLTLASVAIPNNARAIRLAACPAAKYVKLAKPCATRGPTGHRVLRSRT